MKTFTVFGASDDLIETDGIPGCDEFNVYPKDKWAGSFRIESASENARIRVHAIYDGCWTFAVGKVNEDDVFVKWPIRVGQSQETDYSVSIEIDVPDDAILIPEGKLVR